MSDEPPPKGFLAADEANDLVVKLEADNARLRALVKDSEWRDNGCGGFECAHCEAGFYEVMAQHKPDCPAFTPDGVVR